ncbi:MULTISPECIES: hypothetical protein [Mesorhizobium]|uniref:hypothetical protein n=1 Tax=Mesorhizobium TaxID=68287 RepID=UPI0010139022|nr:MULTISPECIES: hypothetical protein [Mesorhizobium]
MGRLRLALVALSMIILPGLTLAALVDGSTVTDNLLRQMVDQLDARGIDVRNGPNANPPGTRPQLTKISNFPASETIGANDPFSSSFNAGAFATDRAALVAIGGTSGVPQTTDRAEFDKTWNASEPSKRIFISFSGKDLPHALAVEEQLVRLGYVTFLYKKSTTVDVNPVEVGRYFQGAAHRYVIDTGNARASPAVNAEALADRYKREGKIPPWAISGGEGGDDVPCCRVCHYRMPGHIRIYCEPPICDKVICSGARPSP